MAIDRIPFMPFYIHWLPFFSIFLAINHSMLWESSLCLSVSVAYVVVDWLNKKFNVKPRTAATGHTKEFATIALPTNCHGKSVESAVRPIEQLTRQVNGYNQKV